MDYEALGYLNRPYNRPFYSLAEMRLVRGMEQLERVYPNWQDWFTVWSSGGLDVNEAEPELLARAAEVSIVDAEAVRDRVLGPDMERGTEDDMPFNSSAEVLDLLNVPDLQRMIVEAMDHPGVQFVIPGVGIGLPWGWTVEGPICRDGESELADRLGHLAPSIESIGGEDQQ